MAWNDRRYVGGTVSIAGWFGSMRGNGKFGQRLNDDPAEFGFGARSHPIKWPC